MKLLNVFTILFFMSLCAPVFTQTYSKEYGVISKSEFELKEYAKDKDAEAVVLFDFGKSRFMNNDNSFDVVFERKTRIKILSKAGLEWAEFEIPLYQDGGIYEKAYEIEATVYNFEGGELKRTVLNKKSIYEEKVNDRWKMKKVALPNVKVGSIIEYKYKVISQYVFNLRDWEFQWKIPVIYSEYETRMIPFYTYTWLLQGASKFSSHTSFEDKRTTQRFGNVTFNEMVSKYTMVNLPAFKDEEFISSPDDYMIKLDFQLSKVYNTNGAARDIMTTWEKLIDRLLKHDDFGKFMKKCKKGASKIIDIASFENKSDEEKFQDVIKYVKQNYVWNKYNGYFASKTSGKLIKDKTGNSADLNLLTISLLNAVGIESEPVLLSTREHGKIKYDYPFAHFFDYVAIKADVGEKTILTDATNIFNSNKMIPVSCLNDKGLIIEKDEINWVNLECDFISKEETVVLVESLDSACKANVKIKATGYNAVRNQMKYSSDKKDVCKLLSSNGNEIDESSLKIKGLSDSNEVFTIKYRTLLKPEKINDKIYISPFFTDMISENPLKHNERSYPIDMVYPEKKSYTTIIKIPEGYKVDYVGKNVKENNIYFNLNYESKLLQEHIQINFSYTFKKAVYSAENYRLLKSYFKQIVKLGNDKLVFSKM